MAELDKIIPFILKWEGGFVNDPYDTGGATNKGVTLGTFRAVYGAEKTAEDLKRLTDSQWQHIIRSRYWSVMNGDNIASQKLANIILDWFWVSGYAGLKGTQTILGVTPDGVFGPQTLKALNTANERDTFERIYQARLAFIGRICRSRPENELFRKGWTNRLNDLCKFVGTL